jgi:hypothetical protein
MSGLSTTLSISLGDALVAGRKRVPSPATGKTALVMGFVDINVIMPFLLVIPNFVIPYMGQHK